jgi:hypothetical protein
MIGWAGNHSPAPLLQSRHALAWAALLQFLPEVYAPFQGGQIPHDRSDSRPNGPTTHSLASTGRLVDDLALLPRLLLGLQTRRARSGPVLRACTEGGWRRALRQASGKGKTQGQAPQNVGRRGSYIRELLPERTEGLGDLSHRSASRETLLDLLALVLGEEHVANLQGHHMSAQRNWSCQVRGPQRVGAARGSESRDRHARTFTLEIRKSVWASGMVGDSRGASSRRSSWRRRP